MTDEEKTARVAALIREREGYQRRGLDERVKAIDDDLRSLGEKAQAPAIRATKRPAPKAKKVEER